MMSFIYLPTLKVQPYKVFGLVLFAVEISGVDYGNYQVHTHQLGWFGSLFVANEYAKKILEGGEQ